MKEISTHVQSYSATLWSSEGWGHHSETETKDSFVLFFALLSALLFGCLVFSTLHNTSQIAQLQQQLQDISDA